MALGIIPLDLGVTAWRELINYNFALLNTQSGGGIPVYASVPQDQQEQLIFVIGIGFMEWDITISPNGYTKNLILTTADLENFKNNLPNTLFNNVAAGEYPIFFQNASISFSSGMVSASRIVPVAPTYTMAVDGVIRATFRGYSANSPASKTAYLRKNGVNISSSPFTSTKSVDVNVEAGDTISLYAPDGVGLSDYDNINPPYLSLFADLDSITRLRIIAIPSIPPYALKILAYDTSGGN